MLVDKLKFNIEIDYRLVYPLYDFYCGELFVSEDEDYIKKVKIKMSELIKLIIKYESKYQIDHYTLEYIDNVQEVKDIVMNEVYENKDKYILDIDKFEKFLENKWESPTLLY